MRSPNRLALLGLFALGIGLLTSGCRKHQPAPANEAPPAQGPTATPVAPRNIPIICMHDLGPQAKNDISIKTADFEQYVKWLHEEGFQTVTAREVAAYLNRERDLPEKPIVLTFDDSWRSPLKVAKPILDRYGYVGVAFLISSSVGANDHKLSWDDCKTLAQAGWEIGSHGKTHENLTRVPKGRSPESLHAMVKEEIEASKAEIEANTGLQVTSFAFPFGNYDTFVMETVKAAGYTAALSIDRSSADEQSDPLRLPRRMIMNRTSFSTFQRICRMKALHIADLNPPPGTRVKGRSVTITGTLTDTDAAGPTGEVLTTPLEVGFEPTTKKITSQAKLGRGANSIALRTPGREASWLVISDD